MRSLLRRRISREHSSADRENLAILYARKKWGTKLITDKGRILFDLEKMERLRETSLPPPRAKAQGCER
jgi:hypothetical protein